MIYYISDTHFFHNGIIKLCNRPFESVTEMNNTLIEKWNSKVTNDDDIYFLGDFAYKCTDEQAIEVAKKLNGKKHFIKGNHDSDKLLKALVNQHIIDDVNIYKEIYDNDKKVVLFHFPIEDWNNEYSGSFHLYGHIHNATNKDFNRYKNRFNVSCEVLDFEPKTLEELIEINKSWNDAPKPYLPHD